MIEVPAAVRRASWEPGVVVFLAIFFFVPQSQCLAPRRKSASSLPGLEIDFLKAPSQRIDEQRKLQAKWKPRRADPDPTGQGRP